jgi:hypothetical protein
MEKIIKNPGSFSEVVRSIGDNILGRVCAFRNKKESNMNNILKRDITGECFSECRDTVREAAVMRQAKINKIMREAEANRLVSMDSPGRKSRDALSSVSRVH